MFAEVKRHKPSVIFIPNIEDWDGTITEAAFTTFLAMLKSIPPTEAVLLLATSECEFKELPDFISKNLFVLSKKNVTVIERPSKVGLAFVLHRDRIMLLTATAIPREILLDRPIVHWETSTGIPRPH